MKEGRRIWYILAGLIAAIIVGGFAPHFALHFAILGEIFLNLLMLAVVPLVFFSIVSGISSLGNGSALKTLGWKTGLYYLLTTFLSVATGLVVVNLVQPGVGLAIHTSGTASVPEAMTAGDVLHRMLLGGAEGDTQGLFARNIVKAMADSEMLPIIFFSILLGLALVHSGDRVKKATAFMEEMNEVVLVMIRWIMALTPLGVFGIVAARIGKAGGFAGFLPELQAVGLYVTAVIMGLLLHSLLFLPLILRWLGRKKAGSYSGVMAPALLNAFSTGSSSATLPLTMELAIEKGGVRRESAGFVLPLGATINMDGTALYEAVAAVFIAQAYGIELSLVTQILILITATVAAIGAAGIPEAGLVTMVIVLKAAGLPVEGIGMILVVDWFLDRLRTTVNVWGDAVAVAVIDRGLQNE